LSILAILCWVKLFKYLCMVGYFRLLVRILEKCAKELIVFSVLLIVVFFGFAVCFFVSFGGNDENFSTLSGSFLVLFFLLIDGYSVDSVWFEAGKPQLIPFVFVIYIAIVYFVLLNVFMAIVLDVYAALNHLHTKRQQEVKGQKMQQVANESFAGLELFPGDPSVEVENRTFTADWMLPSSRVELQKMTNPAIGRPNPVYDIPKTMFSQDVSWSQLQRLMDEDESLPLLLGTRKAVEVIKKFKLGHLSNDEVDGEIWDDRSQEDQTPGGRQEANRVRTVQANVFARVDELERIPPEVEVPNVPEIKALADELSGAVTDVQNQFRIQLTSIIEAVATLFEHLVELTQGIDGVRQNHETVIEMVRENQVDAPSGDGQSSRSAR